MSISDLISTLQEYSEQYGNIDVLVDHETGSSEVFEEQIYVNSLGLHI